MSDDWDQPSLFDPDEGDRRRNEGMARAERHTDPTFAAEAYSIICAFVVPFFGDDVWATLDRRGVPFPHEPRALGPIFRRAQLAGLIEPTGEYRRTLRPSAHRSPQRQWRPTARALAAKSSSGRRGPVPRPVSIPDF
jgi:hypothetical protein